MNLVTDQFLKTLGKSTGDVMRDGRQQFFSLREPTKTITNDQPPARPIREVCPTPMQPSRAKEWQSQQERSPEPSPLAGRVGPAAIDGCLGLSASRHSLP